MSKPDIEELIAAVIEARLDLAKYIGASEAMTPKDNAKEWLDKFTGDIEALDLAYGRAEHALADYVVSHAPWIIEAVREYVRRGDASGPGPTAARGEG